MYGQIKLALLGLCVLVLLTGCNVDGKRKTPQVEKAQSQTGTAVYEGVTSDLENEEVLFSFITTNNKKLIVSYCEVEDKLLYRFFNKNHLEIQLPDLAVDSWEFFEFEDFHQVGSASTQITDVNQLVFINEDYRYEVYDNYEKTGKKRQVGVRVISLKEGQSYEIQGDADSAVGTLMLLYEKLPNLNHRVMGE